MEHCWRVDTHIFTQNVRTKTAQILHYKKFRKDVDCIWLNEIKNLNVIISLHLVKFVSKTNDAAMFKAKFQCNYIDTVDNLLRVRKSANYFTKECNPNPNIAQTATKKSSYVACTGKTVVLNWCN